MANNPLLRRLDEMKRSFMEEGTLLNSHFTRIEELEDETHPNFLSEILEDYFETASDTVQILEIELGKPNPNFSLMDRTLHQLKGVSIIVGAGQVTSATIHMKHYLSRRNLDVARLFFRRLNAKYAAFERKLTEYLNIRSQTRPEVIDEPYEMDDDDSD